MPSIAALRAELAAAEDEISRIQQADNYCMTNGAYDRALAVVRRARQALNDALVQQITDQAAAIVATGRDVVATINGELA